jgi:mono/diheme cytochrome c family protein
MLTRYRSQSFWGSFAQGAERAAALLVVLVVGLGFATAPGAEVLRYAKDIAPLLKEYCHDCHADGAEKGGVAFDRYPTEKALTADHELWLKVLKNVRAGMMPPAKKPQPSAEQKARMEQWIKASVFEVDPLHLDPGQVTVRRLNRTEYRNTIRDLVGVDFDTEKEFPADDAGHGFDNMGDVLTLSPMLLEKYLVAARSIISRGVPDSSRVPAERRIPGKDFTLLARPGSLPATESPHLSYYREAALSNRFSVKNTGRYRLTLAVTAQERFVENQFDQNKCRMVFKADGKELHRQEFTREGGKLFTYDFDQEWREGDHELLVEVYPLTPDQKQVRSLTLRLDAITIQGPMAPEHWVRPKDYTRFFPHEPGERTEDRRALAREILGRFVERAYRRPVDGATVDRLVRLAEQSYELSGKTFEFGVGQAMVAVLASPRFLFREEETAPLKEGEVHPLVDEYSLASRLSYWLWSSMPDEELLRLAGKGELRKNLTAQTQRLFADRKSEAFFRNFVGQWLEVRDIETIAIDARQVLQREAAPDPDFEKRRQRFRELRDRPESTLTPAEVKEMDEFRAGFGRRAAQPLRAELNGDLRRFLRQETEKTVEHVFREDRALIELIDGDYTFLNERLARHYGLTNLNIKGDHLRKVSLPPESPRGGVLTHGSVLAVTSNPTRTSPVKRGLFILNNILGTPPPPPPPDIPPLEDAVKAMKGQNLSLRQTLALHRDQPLCSSCHNRMDPLGLALENFNALGMWRDQERGQPIDATGSLLSGESFTHVRQLKAILARDHAVEFYRTLTEKLLTYALGRGLDYYDVATVDAIVTQLQADQGRAQTLMRAVTESVPFQRARAVPVKAADSSPESASLRPPIPPHP